MLHTQRRATDGRGGVKRQFPVESPQGGREIGDLDFRPRSERGVQSVHPCLPCLREDQPAVFGYLQVEGSTIDRIRHALNESGPLKGPDLTTHR